MLQTYTYQNLWLMKRTFLIVALISFFFNHAQVLSIEPYVSYSLFLPNSKGFKEFQNNYNEQFAAELASPLTNFRPCGAFSWGVDFFSHIGFRFTSYTTESQATFVEGGSRNLELKQNTFSIPLGFSTYSDKLRIRLHFGYYLNLGFCQNTLKSSRTYADGTTSFGLESGLNGIFQSSSGHVTPEFLFGVGKRLYVYATISYLIAYLDTYLTDHSKNYINRSYTYFPNDPSSNDDSIIPNGVQLNMSGLMIGFGLKYAILENKN